MKDVGLVGILNVTPDSFSDGGKYIDADAALVQADRLFADGAVMVDVGAESTRPKAEALIHEEEWGRLAHVLPLLLGKYASKISLDTYHPDTVRRAAEYGECIINDVTSFNNPEMMEVAADLDWGCVISHLPAKFGADIQAAHVGELITSAEQVRDELLARRQALIDRGVDADKIILDPGIGFGKTPELNWELLRFAEMVVGCDVMIGYSRKRFLGEDRMNIEPNLEAGRIAIESGAKYLRVHDVAAHRVLLD